ncbi:hypothetical protein ACFQ1R_11650 [Mariniflexile jejuense]|uniref:MORN repeat protein n=1 Tax=Mariniflexile jejuense TaxID=1173582 RepID=A0ABW3JK48_9FLAO
MKNLLILILFFSFNQLISQEKIGINDVYYENYLAYKISNDKLFSGILQKFRKNGHLVYDEIYESGILIKTTLYLNGKGKPAPFKVILYHEKTFTPKTEIEYRKPPYVEYTHFDINGVKTLNEVYTNDILTYQCKYVNGKKNGVEFCINDDGTKTVKEYINGKKIK